MNDSPLQHAELPAGDASVSQRIISAARTHFFTHGYRTVTMDDLASNLGMSKKTLYAQFPGKTALLEAVLLEKFRDVEADLEQVTVDDDLSDIPATLKQLLACLQRQFQEFQPSFLRDIERETPCIFNLVENFRREMMRRYLGRILEEGRRTGIIRKDVSTELVIEILLGARLAVLGKMEALELTPSSAVSVICTVIFTGLITREEER